MKTKLTKANTNSPSLRTTVPSSIVKMLGLEEGGCLSWELDKNKERWVVKVAAEGI